MPDLLSMFEQRSATQMFKFRNAAYRLFESVYVSEDIDRPVLDLAYRPNNVDGVLIGQDKEIKKIVINQVRRVANHFGAMFAHRPRWSVMALGDQGRAGWQGEYLEYVAQRSNLDAKQPQQSHWLALRGDAVFGVDWNPIEGTEPGVYIRTYDPRHCYPLFSTIDPGACDDMLIAYTVHPHWAESRFGVTGLPPDEPVRVFYLWTASDLYVQVEHQELPRFRRHHTLGVCPFRWIWGDASGLMAQADVREVPKLQEVYNELLLLSLDAVRKQVDPAYWVTNMAKDVHPEPGEATALNEGAQIGTWPVDADPQIILSVGQALEESIQSTTGVSPISMQGQAKGASASGTAVRHQVEAIDSRSETRKVMLEAAYGRLGELVLRVSNMVYPDDMIRFASKSGVQSRKGGEFERNPIVTADYSDFVASSPEMRFQLALQGLGHLWDLDYAVDNVLNLPGVNGKEMAERIGAYQLQMAKVQQEAQQMQQQGQQGQPGGAETAAGAPGGQQAPPGGPPSAAKSQRPSQPSPRALRDVLAGMGGQRNGTGRG